MLSHNGHKTKNEMKSGFEHFRCAFGGSLRLRSLLELFALTPIFITLIACAPANPNSQVLSPNQDETAGVVGGIEATANSPVMRHTVGLFDSREQYMCSGTLIAPQIILTAAHCIPERGIGALKVIFSNKIANVNPSLTRLVAAAVTHPKYNPDQVTDTYDIALVKIFGVAPENYQPASLLLPGTPIEQNMPLLVAGFGINKAWIFKRGEGVLRYQTLTVNDPRYGNGELVMYQSRKKGACSGDSGGPAFLERDGQLILVGVLSRGDSIPIIPSCMLFSIYTRVDAHRSWILDSVKHLTQTPELAIAQ